MKKNIIKEKSFAFALRIVKLNRFLSEEKREFVLSKQLLRSGTAIGALVREAEHAESKADFIHKMAIALKEANETDYWVELLYQSKIIDKTGFESIKPDITELLKLLTSIIKSTCSRINSYSPVDFSHKNKPFPLFTIQII
ncbi:MAG: four helix bundle protein [Deltaproteobacteria bacterium]|nr:four helix bundle protein [Deltaproteobacteria bacterium]